MALLVSTSIFIVPAPSLAALLEQTLPVLTELVSERPQSLKIPRHRVVSEVPPADLRQPLVLSFLFAREVPRDGGGGVGRIGSGASFKELYLRDSLNRLFLVGV